MGLFDTIRGKFSGNEGSARLYGMGQILSQLDNGQTPNAGPALQMLQDRQSQNAMKRQMSEGGEFMNQFSPQERAFLATLPPQAAQQLIAQRIFAAPAAPIAPVEINGQLVNPQTGQVVGDYRTPETPDATYTLMTPEEVAAMPNLNPALQYQRSPDGQIVPVEGSGASTSYIATGSAAAALGLDPSKSYNITSGPEGMKAQSIDGGPLVEINDKAESAFSVETAKLLAGEAGTIVDQGAAAQRALGQLSTLEATLDASPSGFAASLTNFAGGLGIKTDGSSTLEVANAIISQLVPQQRPPNSGTMSDADLELFRQSLPRLINTPEGNKMIIATMRAIADYDIQRMGIARQHQLGAISAEQAFDQYAQLGNPMADFVVPDGSPLANQPATIGGYTIREVN